MSKLCTPRIEALMEQLKKDLEKQRLIILKLEFYMYMEKQGYPDFWETCKGILYPTKVYNKHTDNIPKWYFNFKNGDQIIIPLDNKNKKFEELHGKS